MHRTLTAPTPKQLDSEIARMERAGWKCVGGRSVASIDLSKETAPRSSPLYAMQYVQGMEKKAKASKVVLSILVLLTLAATAQAVDLPESCRIHNRGGRCVLSNCATLGYRHRIPALESLAPNGRVEGREGPLDHEVRKLLHGLNVTWAGRDHGNFDRTLLPLANSRGVIVSMKRGAPWLWGRTLQCNHSIILTSYDADGVSFYCPNNPQQIWRASREWFTFWWMGNSMVFDTHEEN